MTSSVKTSLKLVHDLIYKLEAIKRYVEDILYSEIRSDIESYGERLEPIISDMYRLEKKFEKQMWNEEVCDEDDSELSNSEVEVEMESSQEEGDESSDEADTSSLDILKKSRHIIEDICDVIDINCEDLKIFKTDYEEVNDALKSFERHLNK